MTNLYFFSHVEGLKKNQTATSLKNLVSEVSVTENKENDEELNQ